MSAGSNSALCDRRSGEASSKQALPPHAGFPYQRAPPRLQTLSMGMGPIVQPSARQVRELERAGSTPCNPAPLPSEPVPAAWCMCERHQASHAAVALTVAPLPRRRSAAALARPVQATEAQPEPCSRRAASSSTLMRRMTSGRWPAPMQLQAPAPLRRRPPTCSARSRACASRCSASSSNGRRRWRPAVL